MENDHELSLEIALRMEQSTSGVSPAEKEVSESSTRRQLSDKHGDN
jgi:hypothetical protein